MKGSGPTSTPVHQYTSTPIWRKRQTLEPKSILDTDIDIGIDLDLDTDIGIDIDIDIHIDTDIDIDIDSDIDLDTDIGIGIPVDSAVNLLRRHQGPALLYYTGLIEQ